MQEKTHFTVVFHFFVKQMLLDFNAKKNSKFKFSGLGTRYLQHASRDTTSERWGERTHSKTQAQPR